jgi:hypothetical protein
MTVNSSSSTSMAAFRKHATDALRKAADVNADVDALAGANAPSTLFSGAGKAA